LTSTTRPPAPGSIWRGQRDDLRAELLARLPSVLMALFPAGKVRGKTFVIGDIDGTPGDSLETVLTGEKAGLWTDRATGEGGDVFELIAQHDGLDTRTAFPAVMEAAAGLLGRALIHPAPARHEAPLDELGPHTARWDYLSASGELIACVYRYDPTPGRKEFRPWDVRARMCRAPDPRPLYNLPAVAQTDAVVLVEGEKCADALIRQGIVATTAMNGAKAPVDKTDWTPLAGKAVVDLARSRCTGLGLCRSRRRELASSAGCRSVAILVPPTDKPEKWDAADATDEGFDVAAFIAEGERRVIKTAAALLPTYTLGALLDDDSPAPLDLIAPRLLTPGGMLVLGRRAQGRQERLSDQLARPYGGGRALPGMDRAKPAASDLLSAGRDAVSLPARAGEGDQTPGRSPARSAGQFRRHPAVASASQRCRPGAGDSGDYSGLRPGNGRTSSPSIRSETSSTAARAVPARTTTRQCCSSCRSAVEASARCGQSRRRDRTGATTPRSSASGSLRKTRSRRSPAPSSLRGYYSTGMLLFRSDETQSPRQLLFELRNGPAIPTKHVDKIQGDLAGSDARRAAGSARSTAPSWTRNGRRKRDVILQIIYDEAAKGRCYVATQFSMTFENQGRTGRRPDDTRTHRGAGHEGLHQVLPQSRGVWPSRCQGSRKGYLCVEDMRLRRITGEPDQETGELPEEEVPVLPTHYLCPQTGIYLPVENPQEWVYQEEEEV
jgi:putative DNA primase/helicase